MYNYRFMLRKDIIRDRILQEARWLIDNTSYSIRKLSKEFLISKSQVHRDLHSLRDIDDVLYIQVKNILLKHKKIRG